MKEEISLQQRWNNIVDTNREAAIETLGYVKRKQSTNPVVKKLSEEKKKLGTIINTLSDQTRRKELQKKRNAKLKTIHRTLLNE